MLLLHPSVSPLPSPSFPSSSQDIISQKESLVNKYQSLLQQARRETQSLTGIHAAEMAQLTRQLHKEQEQAFERFKQTSLVRAVGDTVG